MPEQRPPEPTGGAPADRAVDDSVTSPTHEGRPTERGPRRAALEERKQRSKRSRTYAGGALALVAGVALTVVATTWLGHGEAPARPPVAATPTAVASHATTTTLLVGTRDVSGSAPRVVWLALLSYDAGRHHGGVVYIPAHTAAEIPGGGLQALGGSLTTGGIPLLLASTENLLNVPIDHYIEISTRDALALFDATGPVSVDVPSEVRTPLGGQRARLLLSPGLQRLPSSFLVQLLYVVGLDGNDADLGSRHLAFWDGLFRAFSSRPSALGDAVAEAHGALAGSDTSAAQQARMFRLLAALPAADRTLGVLPVEQISSGGDELYQVAGAEAKSFLSLAVGAVPAPDDQGRVQVLNGNGVPGIGQEVGRKLIGHGFRVVLSGNARRLDYQRTLIITYDSSPKGIAEAERARDALGVGEVQVSTQAQGIVNLTVVVGKDFPKQP